MVAAEPCGQGCEPGGIELVLAAPAVAFDIHALDQVSFSENTEVPADGGNTDADGLGQLVRATRLIDE